MNNIIEFIIFIIYSTSVFFIPNNILILCLLLLNTIIMFLLKVKIKKVIKSTLKILPFIIFTFLINAFLDNIINAMYISIKLLVVCNATVIYSYTTSITELSNTIKFLCTPLKIFKINIEEIGLLISISLSILPILKKELIEVKEACKSKNMKFNIKNLKYILIKFLLSVIRRTNYLEEALINKQCN